MTRRPSSVLAATALAAVVATVCTLADATVVRLGNAPASAASDAAGMAGTSGKRHAPSGRVATRDEIRRCLDTQSALDARRVAFEQAQAQHRAHLQALEAETAQVRVQSGDGSDVVAATQALDADAARVNAEVEKATTDQASYEADSQAFDKRCGVLTFRQADLDAVMAERRAAGK